MASTPNYLWSFYHEFENQFIYYLTNGIGIMLVTSLVIVIFGNKKSANIVNVAAADDSLPEQKLHKYTVIIETANSLGVSCDKCTIIQFQVCGKIAKTKYYKLAAYMDDAFIFQRGNKDIFLVKTQDVLGEVEEIKILIDNKKWKPVNAEVMKTSSGEKYKVPVRVLHSDVPGDAEASEVFPVKDKGFCQTVCSSLFRNHHWLSPILVSLRFGAYTSVVNNVMIFVGIVSVLTSTLIVYIVVAPDDGDEFLFDVDSLLWCIYVTMSVFLVIAVLDIILRNVRSGYFPDIRDFLTKMKENEILPNTSNPLQTYLRSKSFNFCSVDPLKSSESSFYSIAESDKDYNKDQGILHDGDLYRSCIEFQKDTGLQQDGDLFKSCTDFHTEMELDRNASAKKNKKKSNSMTKSSTETGSPKGANNNAEQTDAATGTNVKSADSMQGVPLNFSLLDALSEMDGSVISVQEAGEELRDFIKQLTSFLCSKLKHYRRKLEQGDMGCLDNADPFVTKLILSVMKCLSKYILDISFSQGLTIPVIRSRLANYQTLEKETLPDLSSIVICAVMEECTDRLMNEKTISVAHLEEISRKLLEYTCVIAEVFDQKLRLPDLHELFAGQRH